MSADPARTDTDDIASGAVVNGIAIACRVLTASYLFVCARLFGADEVGYFLLAWSTNDLLLRVAIFGLDRGLLKMVAEARAGGRRDQVEQTTGRALSISVGLGLVLVAAVSLGGAPLLGRIFDKPEAVAMHRIVVCAIPFQAVAYTLLFTARGFRVMRFEVWARGIGEPLGMVVGTVAMALWGLRPSQAMGWGLALGGVVTAVVAVVCVGRIVDVRACARHAVRPGRLGPLLRESLPLALYDLVNQLLLRMDVFVLARFSTPEQVGIYGVAVELCALVRKVRQAFDPIFVPVLSEQLFLGEHARVRQTFSLVTRWVLTLDLVLLGVYALLGAQLLSLYGAPFSQGATALVLLVLANVVNGVAGLTELFLLIARPYVNLLNSIAATLVCVVLEVLLVPRFGMAGAGLGIFGAYAAMNVARTIEVFAFLRLQPFGAKLLKPLFAAAVAVGGVLAVRRLAPPGAAGVAVGVLAFVALYGAALLALGLEPEDRGALARLGRRPPAPPPLARASGGGGTLG